MNFQKRISTTFRFGLGALLLMAAVAATPRLADANTAANALIHNIATVNYKDAGGTAHLATSSPPAPPATASTTLSVSSWRIRRPRLAPRAAPRTSPP